MDLPANLEDLYALFESYEPGSSAHLKKFLADAQYKYEAGMQEFVFKPAHSPLEYFHWKIMKAGMRLQLLKSLSSEVNAHFKDSRLVRLLEFPVLFLGATPEKTPAMYSMMNYADTVSYTHLDVYKRQRSQDAYLQAVSQLKDGRGNLISRVQKLRKLGVKSTKQLPTSMLTADLEEEEEIQMPPEAETGEE